MAPIGLKLCQQAFQTILDISFFDAGNAIFFVFSRTLKGRLLPEDDSVWLETLPKRAPKLFPTIVSTVNSKEFWIWILKRLVLGINDPLWSLIALSIT